MSSPIPSPLAFASWLSQNGNMLQPPVNNYCLFSGKDFVLMVVGGPNSRNDFHGMSEADRSDVALSDEHGSQ